MSYLYLLGEKAVNVAPSNCEVLYSKEIGLSRKNIILMLLCVVGNKENIKQHGKH